MGGPDGAVFSVVIDGAGRLAFENRAGPLPLITSSDQRVGPGWHTVELHVWVRGASGTCEVLYDGHPVPALGELADCPTGSAPIQTYAFGDGVMPTRNLALATSPL